ncbi:S4 domain-containing protein YaaA [Carnobacterium pleistocenium]|uniref:S4 domain-containing protein YaaA n=1 Tax=Carnobacterium pleistocenium TaxID=181073 RepID=UPI0005534980|nr:S4 domain-containing protein YaaA [Carnobacterium pleistocenium]
MKKTIKINREFITLGQLLKHVNIISSGGMAKWYLAEHTVLVDAENENRRGKKLYPGSVVEIPSEGTYFIQSEGTATETIEEKK